MSPLHRTKMTPERWQSVQDLFLEAADLPPDARSAFLREACDDAEILTEVEAMLDADGTHRTLFDAAPERTLTLHPDDASSPNVMDEHPSSVSGRRIGPYRIVREIGRGGMGTVYLAERSDIQKIVAIKAIRSELASSESMERFLRERQVLARLEHPNIARLLDAGMTEEHTPFLVMEYVEGMPITDYCDRHQLSFTDRLRLFQHVCQAVHYAHQNLIIHRDLKPTNILVTDDAAVKLLDFGIAKLIEEDDEAEALTRTGMRLMTPEYAAPEQVRGEIVSTAADVYALGILLYELLAGVHPYPLGGRSMGEIERIICEDEPPKPSAASSSRAEPGGADRRRRFLAGDLDVIVMKALSKEPPRRYSSVETLWEDIERYLTGRPVLARPSTFGYRTRKFIQRHSLIVGFTAVTVPLIALLVIVFTLRLAEERDTAQTEAEKAAQVSSFLMGMFEASDPSEAQGIELTARELLGRGVGKADELSDQPEVKAKMLEVLGSVYKSLGEFDQAKPLLEQALALRQAELGPEHPDVAESLNELAVLLGNMGDYETSEPLYRRALSLRRKLYGNEHPDVAETLNDLAILRGKQGEFKDAEALHRQALAMRLALFGSPHAEVAESLNNLAVLLARSGDNEAAVPLAREALEMRRWLFGANHPQVATAINNLAATQDMLGHAEEAEALYREALAVERYLYGEEHPSVATLLHNLGFLKYRAGELDSSATYYLESLDMKRKVFGEDHPSVALTINNIAVLYEKMGRSREAEKSYREALAIRRRALEPDHPDVAATLWGLGRTLAAKGDSATAEKQYLEALAIYEDKLGASHARTKGVYKTLAEFYEARGMDDEAERYKGRNGS